MKKTLLTLMIVLGFVYVQGQYVTLINGDKEVANKSTFVATPTEPDNGKIEVTLKLKNIVDMQLNVMVKSTVSQKAEGSTSYLVIGGTKYSEELAGPFALSGDMDITFGVDNFTDYGVTKISYEIYNQDENATKYEFSLNFFYNTILFVNHDAEEGTNTQMNLFNETFFLQGEAPDLENGLKQYLFFKNTASGSLYYKLKKEYIVEPSTKNPFDGSFPDTFCVPGACTGAMESPQFNATANEIVGLKDAMYAQFAPIAENEEGLYVTIKDKATIKYTIFQVIKNNDETYSPTSNMLSLIVNFNIEDPNGIENNIQKGNGAIFSNAYPNPVKNVVKFDSYKDMNGNATLAIYNMTGAKVMEKEVSTNGTIEVNVSGLNNGLYLYSFSVNGKTLQTKKFVINK